MRKGFTLLELLVVLAIIAIISTMIAVPISNYLKACRNKGGCEVSSSVKEVAKSVASEVDECMKYGSVAQKDVPIKCLKYYK